MLFPCGWPKSYLAFPAKYGHDEIVSCLTRPSSPLFSFPTTFLASKRAVQLWAGTENPFKLGQMFLPPRELLRLGPQVAAEWNAQLSSAICLTAKGWILLYSVTSTGKKLVNRPSVSGPLRDASTVKMTVHATVQLYGSSVCHVLCTTGCFDRCHFWLDRQLFGDNGFVCVDWNGRWDAANLRLAEDE